MLVFVKAQANGFNICFNICSILSNAVERLLNDVELRDGKRFQHFIQQNFASGLVSSSGPRSTRETHATNDRMDHSYVYSKVCSLLAVFVAFEVLNDEDVFQFCVSNVSFFAIVVFFVKDIPQTASLF